MAHQLCLCLCVCVYVSEILLLDDEENKDVQDDIAQENDDPPKEWKTSRNHPLDNIIGDISKGVTT